jgi:hypothetical protein
LNLETEGQSALENTSTGTTPSAISLSEKIAATILLVAFVVLRWKLAYTERWNSDEPQHLHVIWGWVNGFVPYRDFFDNHTPFFHWLFAPVFRSLGERSDILYPMRHWMLPFFLIALLCIARLGSLLWSPRAGMWAAVFAAFFPPFFHMMGQCRTDTLWTTLWLVSLTIFLGGRVTPLRWLLGGVVLGAAFATSMKTTLLLLMLLCGGAGAWMLSPRNTGALRLKIAASIVAALIGICIIPGAFMVYFWKQGAWEQMLYCVIEHNALPGSHTLARILRHFVSYYTLWLLPMAGVLWYLKKHPTPEPERDARRIVLVIAVSVFFPLLHGVWMVMTQQDYVPWYPLVFVLTIPALFAVFDWIGSRTRGWLPPALLALVLVGGEAFSFFKSTKFVTVQNSLIEEIDEVLALTRPGEVIMDSKGETIFRERAFYYVLETLTKRRMADGLIKDEIVENMVSKHVAVLDNAEGRLTEPAQKFFAENYVKVGELWVAGKRLTPDKNGDCTFEVGVELPYTVTDPKSQVSGTLDGLPIDGPRTMKTGQHQIHLTTYNKNIALLWARAAGLGFSPFHPRMANAAKTSK